jgi:ABC-type phosphate/phosphonate transport system substrate-binding protein
MHYVMSTLMNEFLGTRLKVITGYSGGTAMTLAVERGEVDGRVVAWSAIKTTKPQWVAEKKINILAQLGPSAADLGEVPNVEDLVTNAKDRELIHIYTSANRLGRPLATAPDVPEARVAMLRAAFDATMKTPAFLADAKAANVDVDPVRGADMDEETRQVLAILPATVRRAKALLASD